MEEKRRSDFEKRDRARVEAEKRYAEEHPERIRSNKRTVYREKSTNLKKKLNNAILVVVVLIIIVYLILFYL